MLTPIQSSVLTYLRRHQRETGNFPTLREISDHFGWMSDNASHEHLSRLKAKGYITWTTVEDGNRAHRSPRSLQILEAPPETDPPIVNNPQDTDWDQVCRDAERYRWIKHNWYTAEGPEGMDAHIDQQMGVQHEASTTEPSSRAIHPPGAESNHLGGDRLADLVSFNKALREDQE